MGGDAEQVGEKPGTQQLGRESGPGWSGTGHVDQAGCGLPEAGLSLPSEC